MMRGGIAGPNNVTVDGWRRWWAPPVIGEKDPGWITPLEATGLTVNATTAQIVIQGQQATVHLHKTVAATLVDMAIAGLSAAIQFGRFLAAQVASMEITGLSANVSLSRAVSAAATTFEALTSPCSIRFHKTVDASFATALFAGLPATIEYTSSGGGAGLGLLWQWLLWWAPGK